MIPIFPVANGVMPRPHGGKISGVFLAEQGGAGLVQAGVGREVLICPWVAEDEGIYPIGVRARILDLWSQRAEDEAGNELAVLMAVLEGSEHARWHTLRAAGSFLVSDDVETMDFKASRKEYPVISGAGWVPAGGYTEFRDSADIPVTVYGTDLERGREVSVKANLGGLVSQEQAHTIEHGIIRALHTYGLCTPRTLIQSMSRETAELRRSVELGFRFAMPEILGRTHSGACGNPMTNLAQFYLAQEFIDNVAAGKSLPESILAARRKAMSHLTGDLGLTAERGLRALQGLKKGMAHDDTPLKVEICKKVLSRFSLEPWL